MTAVWAVKGISRNESLIRRSFRGVFPQRELGCGSYGCVYETNDPDIVFKITSDQTEAEFIELMKERGIKPPEGITKYWRIVSLEGKHRNRPLYGIWRETAIRVGLDPYSYSDPYERNTMAEFSRGLQVFAAASRYVFQRGKTHEVSPVDYDRYVDFDWNQALKEPDKAIKRLLSRYSSVKDRIRVALNVCQVAAEMLGSTPYAYLVGEALGEFLEQGILLSDVHANNVGEVEREDYGSPIWVITDPGHVLVFGA